MRVQTPARDDATSTVHWLRLRQRIADYSGTATTRFWWLIEGNSIKKTYWNPAFRYGDDVSSQQLLTVDDGVENLLNSAGVYDLSDFPTTVKMASVRALDSLPTEGSEAGHAFRDLDWENEILEMTRQMGIGA
ncbi:MAG: hypothetical protein EBY57_08815, partial [Actinobacteria bacterium]|nr:hypothetical protein [Actinomycetota bacterium]